MLQTLLIFAAVTLTSKVSAGSGFTLTESTRCDTVKKVIQNGSSPITEETTSFQGHWKVEAKIPFSATDWSQLSQNQTVSIKIGKEVVEETISEKDGFNPKSSSFTFKLTRPVVAFSGYKYITLPTDKPAPPAPAPGTRVVYGQGSLEFKDGTLKITFSTAGKSGISLAGESFVAVEDGSFEGKLPLELTAGTQHIESELKISGTAKHRDSLKDDPMGTTLVGRSVQLNLTGKA